MESGTLGKAKGEAVAMKDKRGKCGIRRIETMKSRRSLQNSSFSFRINAINVRYRQLVKDILVNTRA